jgi:predicted protein tyrosine phosphatase
MTTMNRLHNCRNPNQRDIKRVLCLCSAGLLRSPTTAVVLQREFGYNTRSAGTNEEYALILADEVLYTWADEIVAVEKRIADRVPDQFKDKLITLNVPDVYRYMEEELQEIILEQYKNES